jgi:hypothetical protein
LRVLAALGPGGVVASCALPVLHRTEVSQQTVVVGHSLHLHYATVLTIVRYAPKATRWRTRRQFARLDQVA